MARTRRLTAFWGSLFRGLQRRGAERVELFVVLFQAKELKSHAFHLGDGCVVLRPENLNVASVCLAERRRRWMVRSSEDTVNVQTRLVYPRWRRSLALIINVLPHQLKHSQEVSRNLIRLCGGDQLGKWLGLVFV